MKINEWMKKIEERFPLDAAEEWDNPGLLAGRADREARRIFVALDVTEETLREALDFRADLMITHHPLIFGGIRAVSDADHVGRRLLAMIEQGISYYAMHTNFDVVAMGEINARQLQLRDDAVLGITGERDGIPEGIGRVGMLPREMTLRELATFVREQMELPEVRVYGDPDAPMKKAAVSGGSGKSMVADALRSGADVLISSDLDYHNAIDAVADGLCYIDAGHYGTEYGFIGYMTRFLSGLAPDCAIAGAATRHPFFVS